MGNKDKQPASVKSAETATRSLQKEISSLFQGQVTYNKESGFFLTKAKFLELEQKLDEVMEKGTSTSVSPTALIELNDQLQIMATRAQKAEEALAASEAKSTALRGDLKAARGGLVLQATATRTAKADLDKEKEKVKALLAPLEAEQKASRKKASDPDTVAERALEIAALHKDLAVINAKYKSETAKVNTLHAQVSQMEEAANLERLTAERLRAATFKASEEAKADLDRPLEALEPMSMDLKKDGAILRKVFSEESLNLLHKAAEERRTNTREYAFTLFEFAKKRDPKNFVGYKDYMYVLFNKVKSASAKKRSKYLPVLDAIYDSMAFDKSKPFKSIKDTYAVLFQPEAEITKENEIEVTTGSPGWWSSFVFDVRTFVLSTRLRWSIFKKEKAGLLPMPSFLGKVRTFAGKLKSRLSAFFTRAPAPV